MDGILSVVLCGIECGSWYAIDVGFEYHLMSSKIRVYPCCALYAVVRTVLDNSHRDRRVDDRSHISSTVAYPEPHHEIEGQSSLKQMQRSEENKRDVTVMPTTGTPLPGVLQHMCN